MIKTRTAQCLLVLATMTACGGAKDATKDTTAAVTPAAAPATAATAAAKTPADFAGTWQMTANLTGAAKPVPGTLVGTPDGKFTLSLEGRPNIAETTSMSGDSLVNVSAEYESVLRKGVMVTVRTATVMSGDSMMGSMVATYKTPKGQEVVPGTFNGTRKAM